jgi:hypothetical protein
MSFLRKTDASLISRGSADADGMQATLECDLVGQGTVTEQLAAGPIGTGVQQRAERAIPAHSTTVKGADG